MSRGFRLAAVATSFAVAFAVLFGALSARPARGEEVDVQIVLAVDVSLSMDNEEQAVQRRAYVEAFRSRVVVEAARHGPHGRIAVAMVEWSGTDEHRLTVPWTLIHDEASAHGFAAAMEAAPIVRMRRTDISSALMYAAALMEQSPWRGTRRVIDISGDGSSNEGDPINEARDAVLARGIVINGLPLVLDRTGTTMILTDQNPITLEDYYRECVIGGPGSFLVPVTSIEQLTEALKTKLVIEIADLAQPRIVPAQAEEAPRRIADCHGRFSF